jgi:hypothetical protein
MNKQLLAMGLALASLPLTETSSAPASSGAHDFDWEIGTWTTSVRILTNPLSAQAPKWAAYTGTSVVKPLLDGRANFVELSVAGPAGKIEGGSLRLYASHSGQWSLNYANLRNGLLTSPVYGAFDKSGHGRFSGSDTLDGRAILVRFDITKVAGNMARFEQAYSGDGGVTWETNWVAVDTRR